MLYKIHIRKCHSLASEMTPSRHLLNWLQFSNSNYVKLNLQRFQMRLQRSLNAHALPIHPILAYPMPLPRQTRSQTTIHTQDITNAPLPPRVVTPRRLNPSPPRVPTCLQRLSPCNLYQNDFCGMDTAHMAISLGDNHWSQRHHANAVIHPVTGKEMEYKALMKDPSLQPLWTRGFGNKCGRIFQGIRDIPGTETCFFIKLTNIPKDRKITYGKIVCDYKPHKKEK
jgi:hypothetical protein